MKFPVGRSIVKVPVLEATLPSLPRQALNAGKAVLRVAQAAVTRKPIWLTPAVREEHRAICQSNQCGFYRQSDQRCGHPKCGCFTKLKTLLATESCPVGLFKRDAEPLHPSRSEVANPPQTLPDPGDEAPESPFANFN